MLGLPTEEIKDLDGIIGLTGRAMMIGRGLKGGRRKIRISLSTFVPKPHTPFQWIGQIPGEEIAGRQGYLRSRLRNGDIDLQMQRPEISLLEALLSRGDRRVGRLIERAWNLGCRFDGWTEVFSYERWKKAFIESGIDPLFYAHRNIAAEETLPWDHIDTGVTKDFLVSELEKSGSLVTTPDCRHGDCYNCGVCTEGGSGDIRPFIAEVISMDAVADEHPDKKRSVQPDYFRVRMKYKKEGEIKHISQLEFMSSILRAINRGGIPIAFSEGFHPHPRVSLGHALPCGMESSAEYLDMVLLSGMRPSRLAGMLNEELPEGIRIVSVGYLHPGSPSLSSSITGLAYVVDLGNPVFSIDIIIEEFMKRGEIQIKRISKSGEQDVDIRPMLLEMKPMGRNGIFMFLESINDVHCRPQEVIQEVFRGCDGLPPSFAIKRIGQYIKRAEKWYDPIDLCGTNKSEREA
ncbi:MAG: TIGR03936 family radical SAM-associated protein, partial [Nitrospirota bacterium]